MTHKLVCLIIFAATALTCFSGQLAPKIKPLPEELVGVLFQRIERQEKIEFDLLCQALIGPQTTLRAYAATLLADSEDKRAIPFLIDALSDESMHVGADYVDPGDATTRYRANKALKKLTGEDFGFVWSDPKDKRDAAIQKWIAWYKKQVEPIAPANGAAPRR
jgi:HEAT repeat protein